MRNVGRRLVALALVVGLAGFGPGCGGGGGGAGGGSPSGAAAGTTDTAIFVKDVPVPVPLSDGTFMDELFLRVTGVDLTPAGGGAAVNVSLAGPAGPATFVDFDLLDLDDTATLLAFGNIPIGTFTQLVLTLDPASCTLVRPQAPLGNGASVGVGVPNPTLTVSFVRPIDTSVNQAILMDIRPDRLVAVVTPGTQYELRPAVGALVAGPFGSAPGLPATIPVRNVGGIVTAAGTCPTFTMNRIIAVDTTNATIVDAAGNAVLCSAIAAGNRVAVAGTLTVGPGLAISIAATNVVVSAAPTAPPGGLPGGAPPGTIPPGAAPIRLEGTIANLAVAAPNATFDLVRGRGPGVFALAKVTVDASTALRNASGASILLSDLNDGDDVAVIGTIASATPGAVPPLQIAATEVEKQ